ncbi:hypothetical protein B0T25DRAFT_511599 [Lasiosphaeria hispida]|uniref:Azaphilone pigments biosynthesis cluster protein L N-terminal domain-containing protein n=1 Tax=Lasiosphaeria hispida TaxID=260671 RepID=A0AAJ0H820_9PEZI|nr:hypothetical protein B0T25DRAFT_511599 [Lasiosphaeria hispida]
MDPVSAGSSILAFVVLALKSARAIHELLSAVKDGPQSLRHLAGDIAQLQGILERLSNLQPESIDEGGARALEVAASRCVQDVGDIESKLARFTISPTDKHAGKLWKRLLTAIGEKDLMQMQDLVRCHFMMLGVQLGMLQTTHMSASRNQLSEMLDSLNQLKEQVSTLRNSPTSAPATAESVSTSNGSPEVPRIDLELEQCIYRLVEYINGKESTVASDDAQQMIEDLEALLRSAEREESKADSHPCDQLCGEEPNVSRELKLIRRLIASAPQLAVNETGSSQIIPAGKLGMVVHQNRQRKVIQLPGGNRLVLHVNRRTRVRRDSPSQGNTQETTAKVLLQFPGKKSSLVISLNQAWLDAGSFLSIPRLAVHNVVPKDSPIFKLAADGNIQEILALVRTGQASLHDHDENGWSLLHHSAERGHLTLCKLLIQHGLDVDGIAAYTNGNGTDSEATPLHLSRHSPEAFKCLLEAGADPTVGVRYFVSVFFITIAEVSRDEPLSHIFNISTHFINPQERGYGGRTPFLMSFSDCGPEIHLTDFQLQPRDNIKTLSLFLDNGSSVQERDSHGATCLHILLCGYIKPPSEEDWHDSLKFLIRKGADVCAKDNDGRSVSHVAYSPTCWDQEMEPWSYRGDLWDAVLDASGHDIWDFRRGYPRTARYTTNYTRRDFEALWKGREERCPYWNDTHWSSPLDDETSSDKFELACYCEGGCDVLDTDNNTTDEEQDGTEGGWSGEDEEEDEEDHENQTWGPSSPSREGMQGGASSPAPPTNNGPEPEPPYVSSLVAGEAHGLPPDETNQGHLWSNTVQYEDNLGNPWLDDYP